MDKRKLTGILIIIAGLIILVALIYFMFFYGQGPAVTPEETTGPSSALPTTETTPTKPQPGLKPIIELEPLSEEEITQADLEQLATSFAERFGSYSNQSDFSNIKDLKIFMTAAMQVWADNYIEKLKQERGQTDIYQGVTTTAVASEVKQFDETAGYAEIIVQTQRRQATISTDNVTIDYQDIIIKLVRQGGTWKVDGAYWQDSD